MKVYILQDLVFPDHYGMTYGDYLDSFLNGTCSVYSTIGDAIEAADRIIENEDDVLSPFLSDTGWGSRADGTHYRKVSLEEDIDNAPDCRCVWVKITEKEVQ